MVEEIIPAGVSDATRLAPQEVYSRVNQAVKGADEVTSGEKARQRLVNKKLFQREKRRREYEDNLVKKFVQFCVLLHDSALTSYSRSSTEKTSAAGSKKAALDQLVKSAHGGTVKVMKDSSKTKHSTAKMFAKLQEGMAAETKGSSAEKKTKRQKTA